MSFMGGAECSTGANPLASFSKHVQNDQSLQRDRMVNRGPGASESMRTQHQMGQQDHMMNEFMQQNGSLSNGPPQPFAMDQMRREMERFSPQGSRSATPGWASEFDKQLPNTSGPMHHQPQQSFRPPGFNAAEFERFQQAQPNQSQMPQGPAAASTYQRPYNMGYMGMGAGMGMGSYTPMMHQQQPLQSNGKGKERMVELDDKDWEQQFAALDAGQTLDEDAQRDIESELNDVDRSVAQEQSETVLGDFEAVWRGIQAEREANRQLNDDEAFEAFNQQNPWSDFDNMNINEGFRDPQLGDYMFEEENVFRTLTNPFEEGVRIMEEKGNLSMAALAFEAAVQKDPQHVQAWVRLGSAQAQNEKEAPAIRALEQAVKVDPNNLEALMGLAVSYTNDGYDATAYRTLERWLSVKYPQIIAPDQLSQPADVGFTDRQQLHERITNLFIKAAQLSPNGEQMDPDVQVGLGVLFYGCEEYDKAVDCFEAALHSTEQGTSNQRNQIHLLWNRLGATLANSGKSEQAIEAYEKALQTNKNFVRARYNLGVSCINMGCYSEAVQHFLGALQLHAEVEREGRERIQEVTAGVVDEAELNRMMAQNQSTNLYETLRRALIQMDRRDLAEKVLPGMDIEMFRKDFDF